MSKPAAASKADTAVKLVLIFFITLLSFSVGTFVGKQVSDSDNRKAELEGDGHEQKTAAHDEEAMDENTKPVSDEDVASLSEEVMKAEREVASDDSEAHKADHHGDEAKKADKDGYVHHTKLKGSSAENAMHEVHDEKEHKDDTATHAEAPTTAHASPEKGHASHAEKAHASSAAERVAHDKAPAADPKLVRTPTAKLPPVATTTIGKYTVQVGSYATEKEATSFAEKLKEKGFSAFYVPAEVSGKTWYRVSVGVFADQKSATNYRTELLSTQAVSSAIVQKIIK